MPDRNRASKVAHREGLWHRSYAHLMRSLKPTFNLFRVEVRELGQLPATETSAAEIRVVTPEELEVAQQDMPEQLATQGVKRAVAQGDVCVGAFVDGKLVSFVWRCYTTAAHTDRVWAGFDPPYRYGYKSYTLPEYRGRHLLSLAVSDPICLARGFTHALAFIETHNYASQRMNRRFGNKLVGFAGYLELFGRVFCFRTPGAKRHTFRFYEPGNVATE